MAKPELFVALDVNGTTYLDRPGAKEVVKTSPHVTPEGYEFTKDLAQKPADEIAQVARAGFVLVRPLTGDRTMLEPNGLLYLLERSLASGVTEIEIDPDKREFLEKDKDQYYLDKTIPDSLTYVWSRGVSTTLNTGAKPEATNAEALLLMARQDHILNLLNPSFPIAMRPSTVAENLRDRIKSWSTPDSKALFNLWLGAKFGVDAIAYTDTHEDREGVILVGGDVGLNAPKAIVDQKRKRDVPSFVQPHLDPDALQLTARGLGRSIYNVSLADMVSWKLGTKELPLREVGQNEFEVTEPNFVIQNLGIPIRIPI